MAEMIKINTRVTSASEYKQYLESQGITILREWHEAPEHVFMVSSPPPGYRYDVMTSLPSGVWERATSKERVLKRIQEEQAQVQAPVQTISPAPITPITAGQLGISPAKPTPAFKPPIMPITQGTRYIVPTMSWEKPFEGYTAEELLAMPEAPTFRPEEAAKVKMPTTYIKPPPPMLIPEATTSTEWEAERQRIRETTGRYPTEYARELAESLVGKPVEYEETKPSKAILGTLVTYAITTPAAIIETPITVTEAIGYAGGKIGEKGWGVGGEELMEEAKAGLQQYGAQVIAHPITSGIPAALDVSLLAIGGYGAAKGITKGIGFLKAAWSPGVKATTRIGGIAPKIVTPKTIAAPTTARPTYGIAAKVPKPQTYQMVSKYVHVPGPKGKIGTIGKIYGIEKATKTERLIVLKAETTPIKTVMGRVYRTEIIKATEITKTPKVAEYTTSRITGDIFAKRIPQQAIKTYKVTSRITKTEYLPGQVDIMGVPTNLGKLYVGKTLVKQPTKFLDVSITRRGVFPEGARAVPVKTIGKPGPLQPVRMKYPTTKIDIADVRKEFLLYEIKKPVMTPAGPLIGIKRVTIGRGYVMKAADFKKLYGGKAPVEMIGGPLPKGIQKLAAQRYREVGPGLKAAVKPKAAVETKLPTIEKSLQETFAPMFKESAKTTLAPARAKAPAKPFEIARPEISAPSIGGAVMEVTPQGYEKLIPSMTAALRDIMPHPQKKKSGWETSLRTGYIEGPEFMAYPPGTPSDILGPIPQRPTDLIGPSPKVGPGKIGGLGLVPIGRTELISGTRLDVGQITTPVITPVQILIPDIGQIYTPITTPITTPALITRQDYRQMFRYPVPYKELPFEPFFPPFVPFTGGPKPPPFLWFPEGEQFRGEADYGLFRRRRYGYAPSLTGLASQFRISKKPLLSPGVGTRFLLKGRR